MLNVLGLIRIELPPALLIASYALIGWNTGLRFTGDVLAAAARALPQCLGATPLLLSFCGLLAWMLTRSCTSTRSPPTWRPAGRRGRRSDHRRLDQGGHALRDGPADRRLVVILAIGPQLAKWAAGTLKPGAARPAAPRSGAEPLDLGDVD